MKMKLSATLTAIILLFALVSCSKEESIATGATPGGGTTPGTGTTAGAANITGKYTFISLQAKTNSMVQTEGGPSIIKTVTTSDYTTQNNTGTVTFDANTFTSSNLSYSANTIAKSTLYENGVVSDTFSLPFQFNLPSTSGTSTYKRIGTDSLYLASGFISIGGSSGASLPSGAKIKLVNGTLTLTTDVLQSTTTTDQGVKVTSISSATAITTLQKQ